MRALIATMFLAFPVAALAQPSETDIATYRAKLAEYVAKTDDVDAIIKGLTGWYGWTFLAVRDYTLGTVDYLVKTPVLGNEIRYLRTIGTVLPTAPRALKDEEK